MSKIYLIVRQFMYENTIKDYSINVTDTKENAKEILKKWTNIYKNELLEKTNSMGKNKIKILKEHEFFFDIEIYPYNWIEEKEIL